MTVAARLETRCPFHDVQLLQAPQQPGVVHLGEQKMEFDVVRALGVRVVEIEDFGRVAQYLPGTRVLLIDAGLDRERREFVSCHLLGRLFVEQAA